MEENDERSASAEAQTGESKRYTEEIIPAPIAALAGARFGKLRPNSKRTYSAHGHLDAQPWPIVLPRGANYALILDGWGILVDFDREDTEGWRDRLRDTPPLIRQRSAKGEHWIWRTPPGWRGRNRKFPAGDVKSLGYFVGPGSTVNGWTYRLDELNPDAPYAPEWLMEYVTGFGSAGEATTGQETDHGADVIVDGAGRHDFLVRIAGGLRRAGLSRTGIEAALGAVNEVVVSPPKLQADIKTIAKSTGRWQIAGAESLGPLRAGNMVMGNEVQLVQDPIRWWVRNYVPRGELVMVFGRGGSGKSSWASWLAAQVTQRGGRFHVITIEETFGLFLWRAHFNGANLSLISAPQNGASALKLPRDAGKLRDFIDLAQIDVLYFDSIYSHFASEQGLNAAERARACLSPLAEIAKETGCTILCTFHENKAGQLLGSVEMENVARYVLHAKRDDTPDDAPMKLRVHKTNGRDPHRSLIFRGRDVVMIDPSTGETQYEEVDDAGTLEPMKILVSTLEGDESAPGPSTLIDPDDIPAKKDDNISGAI